MTYQFITYEQINAVAVVTLNRPDKLNALSEAMYEEILHALAQARSSTSVRALLITGQGKLFSAGADLGELTGENTHGLSMGGNVARMMRELFNKTAIELHEFPVPVVIALNGGVAGGGVGLALSGDVIVAARSAYFYLPFVPRLGLIPDLGATWFLERALGRARALALSLTGARWSAEQAGQWGMLHAVYDDEQLPAQALQLAHQLASLPAHGVIEARQAFDAATGNDLRSQLAYEACRQGELLDSPAFVEGVTAFFNKREPSFVGR